MNTFPGLIQGKIHDDYRGKVAFVNDFDMSAIKRFYQIEPKDINHIRAWQGHQKESKWFYCVKGEFIINYTKPNDWVIPVGNETVHCAMLSDLNSSVLHIPNGYVTGIKPSVEGGILMVYSDYSVEESKLDDFRYSIDTWQFIKN